MTKMKNANIWICGIIIVVCLAILFILSTPSYRVQTYNDTAIRLIVRCEDVNMSIIKITVIKDDDSRKTKTMKEVCYND